MHGAAVDHDDAEVCIIGAGISGIAAADELRRRGVSVVVVERANTVGGLWRTSSDRTATPAYDSLRLNTSRRLMALSRFPMPDDWPLYPDITQIGTYLRDVVDRAGLHEVIELRTTVTGVRQRADRMWEVLTTRDGVQRRRRYAHVIVATGRDWWPTRPTIPGADEFTGAWLHSYNYDRPDRFAGQRVVVLGAGASAADIAVDVSRTAEQTFLSARRPAWVVPKRLWGTPIDEIALASWWTALPLAEQQRRIEAELRALWGEMPAGLRPDHRPFERSMTPSDDLIPRVAAGRIQPRPGIAHVDGDTVTFDDGTSEAVDAVIAATGYDLDFPFLGRSTIFDDDGRAWLYQRVIPPRHPGLYVVGIVRPFGSATRLAEAQTRWVADLITGAAVLPDTAEMDAEITTHLATTARYGSRSVDSVQVHSSTYLRALAAAHIPADAGTAPPVVATCH